MSLWSHVFFQRSLKEEVLENVMKQIENVNKSEKEPNVENLTGIVEYCDKEIDIGGENYTDTINKEEIKNLQERNIIVDKKAQIN